LYFRVIIVLNIVYRSYAVVTCHYFYHQMLITAA